MNNSIAKKTVTLIMSIILAVTFIFAAGESTYAKVKVKKPAKPDISISWLNLSWKKYSKNKNCGVFDITWEKSKNAKKYRLFEKKAGKWKALIIIKAKKNGLYKGKNYTVSIDNGTYTWKLTKSPLGKTRYFKIRAINGKKKTYSNVVSGMIEIPRKPYVVPEKPIIKTIETDVGTFVLGEKATVTLGGTETRTMTVKKISREDNGDTVIEGKANDVWGIWITVDKTGKMYLYRYAYWDEYYWEDPGWEYYDGELALTNTCWEPSTYLSVLWSNDGIEPVEGQEERTITDPDTGEVYPLCGKVAYTDDYPGCFLFYDPKEYVEVHKKLLDKVVIWYKIENEYEYYEVIK